MNVWCDLPSLQPRHLSIPNALAVVPVAGELKATVAARPKTTRQNAMVFSERLNIRAGSESPFDTNIALSANLLGQKN
jgi:hypothetical protein